MFLLEIPRNDKDLMMKLRFANMKTDFRECQIPTNYKDKKCKETFGFLRLAYAQNAEFMMIATDMKSDELEPLSIRNEVEVLSELKRTAEKCMSAFQTTIEEDEILLKDPKLTFNQRNCVIVRRGEKQVYRYYIELANFAIPLLEGSWDLIKKVAAKVSDSPFEAYITNVIVPLVKKKN